MAKKGLSKLKRLELRVQFLLSENELLKKKLRDFGCELPSGVVNRKQHFEDHMKKRAAELKAKAVRK